MAGMTGQPRYVRIPMSTVIKGFTAANIQMIARRPADSAGIQKKPTFLTHMHLDQRRTVRIAMATVIKGCTAPDIKMLARRPVDSAEVPKSLIFPSHWHPGLSAWMTFPTVLNGMWTVKYMEMHARRPVDSVTMTMTIRMTMMTMTLAVLIITTDCPEIAANNWCPIYKGKCCKSCKKAEKKEDPSCMDEASGCRHYKTFMCKQYPKKCKNTCGLCNGGFGAETKGPRAYGVFGAAAGQPEEQASPDVHESQEECVDVWADDCPEIAENNWCHLPSYKGKCCKSCKTYEENKGDCFDEEEGCVKYNEDNYMCKNYRDKCKKTCKMCE